MHVPISIPAAGPRNGLSPGCQLCASSLGGAAALGPVVARWQEGCQGGEGVEMPRRQQQVPSVNGVLHVCALFRFVFAANLPQLFAIGEEHFV